MSFIDLTLETGQVIDVILDLPEVVELTVSAGLEGPPGPKGDPGAAGAGAIPIVYTQEVPSAVWIVTHNLGYWPDVTVYTVAGERMLPDVIHGSLNTFTVIHANPETGIITYR